MPEYENPKIFSDLLIFFKKCYSVHQGLPKLFRIAVSEKLLNEITECMKLVAMFSNVLRKSQIKFFINRRKKVFDINLQKIAGIFFA